MKRLAIVVTHPIQYYAPLFNKLTDQGKIQVKVFYTKPVENTHFDSGFNGLVQWDIPLLTGYEYEFQPAGNFKQNRNLIETLRSWQPSVILVFGWNFPGHLAVMRYFKNKIPVWFRGDSTLLNEKPGWHKILRRIVLKWVYRHVDCALYVGSHNKAYYSVHGLKEEQLVFMPHAIDNLRYAGDEGYDQEARIWRKNLGISTEDFVVAFVGKLEPIKNPRLLLQAVLELNKTSFKSESIKLLYIGSGILEKELKGQANNDSNVYFLGFQNQAKMPIAYRLGDIICLPSKSETWGLAVNEAMACGRPVIVSDQVGCAVNLVVSGKTGYIFKAGDVTDLKNILSKITKEELSEMGTAASKLIENWSFEKQIEAIIGQLKNG
ncbi:glycosyltransferase family 4 protein [Haliscomenobacter hydrossis]|uniref:Glycosyl transferase group 1 n=1 Tax=Haliscomenobacter hydrossis (strain ATCC 27775 / DSM 1100 / LMG 10767 / O) TaxID=760192 RepID=F4L448_HALH1|nr:glycosyltransferase family 4 protein [Haliscomenobacter hydrossis]AEE50746.1 glycosyl transferase group 1 [Haliscomenobacter hydrossis DSM 1100]